MAKTSIFHGFGGSWYSKLAHNAVFGYSNLFGVYHFKPQVTKIDFSKWRSRFSPLIQGHEKNKHPSFGHEEKTWLALVFFHSEFHWQKQTCNLRYQVSLNQPAKPPSHGVSCIFTDVEAAGKKRENKQPQKGVRGRLLLVISRIITPLVGVVSYNPIVTHLLPAICRGYKSIYN